jgi:tRNA(Ile)-lysidine synthase
LARTPAAGKPRLDASLFAAGDRVLVGLSGGADSLTLLHLLVGRAAELDLDLFACHVHHGMRGEAAEEDVRFLHAECDSLGVPLIVSHGDVPALCRAHRWSPEEAGRHARYAEFEEAALAAGCTKVATAHTADDQAETVLMNLMRGCGLDGLAGIPRRRPLIAGRPVPEVVRPLLGTWRAEIESFCGTLGKVPRHDSTNDDLRFLRNRVRRRLLPSLMEWDRGIKRHLVRLSEQAWEERLLLRREAVDLLSAVRKQQDPLVLDAVLLAAAPEPLVRRALLAALGASGADANDATYLTVGRLMAQLRGEGPASFDLPGGRVRAKRGRGELRLEACGELPAAPPSEVRLRFPGELRLDAYGIRLSGWIEPPPGSKRLPRSEALIRLPALEPPLCVRPPLPGDRFRPFGAPGSRLLSDLLSEHRVPRVHRPTWPVLVDQAGILWVVGIAVAERARIESDAEPCLHLRAETLPGQTGAGGLKVES